MDCHKEMVDNIIDKMKATFGESILDKYEGPIRFFTKKVEKAINEIGRDNMRLIQPETRKTIYQY